MRIKKVRIKNFKSIIDSGDCYFENDLTIFAGKNESGKTSILEALEAFNADKAIPKEALPISKTDELPEITLTIVLTPDDLNEYYKKAGIETELSTEKEIEITKMYSNEYYVNASTESLLGLDMESEINEEDEKIQERVSTTYQQLKQFYNQYSKSRNWQFFNLNFQDIPGTKNLLSGYLSRYLSSYITQIPDEEANNAHRAQLQKLQQLLDELQNAETEEKKPNKWDLMFDFVPNFILFNSFDDILPNQVSFDKLEENEFIQDLSIISDLDIDLITSDDERSKGKHKRELNVSVNDEYKQFWVQDLTKINIEWNSDTLFFWIEEDGELYKQSERSKGKQWHMSFYTKVTARALEKRTNVILIDEPGLFLHAAAQKDIYKKLIDRSKHTQILFTTHSPYLIDRDELHRVRLVIKEDTSIGTKVENKIHAKSDKETLTPVLTAIGLGLSDGIQNVNQDRNVVVEGPSDYFYLQGFKLILGKSSLNIVYGGGAGNMGKVGAILNGWGCKVLYLFDNDKGKTDGSKNLKKVWFVAESLIQLIKEDAGTIEDIFSRAEFKKYVLKEDDKEKFEGPNSNYIKKNKLDKVLLARQFNSLCHEGKVKLGTKTEDLIDKLFQRLENTFNAL